MQIGSVTNSSEKEALAVVYDPLQFRICRSREEARQWMRENGIQMKYKPPSRNPRMHSKANEEEAKETSIDNLSVEQLKEKIRNEKENEDQNMDHTQKKTQEVLALKQKWKQKCQELITVLGQEVYEEGKRAGVKGVMELLKIDKEMVEYDEEEQDFK